MGRGERGHRPWVWVTAGASTILVGVVMSLVSLRAWGDRDAYRRAEQCELGTRDCVLDRTAVVQDKHVRRRRSDEYTVSLRYVHPERGLVTADWTELPEPDDVWDDLTPGREVNVRLWDGRVAWIEVPGGGAAETEHSPLTASVEYTLFGLLATFGGGWGVWGGVTMGRRHGWRRAPHAALKGDVRGGRARLLLATLGGLGAVMLLVVPFDVYEPKVFLAVPAVGSGVWWATGPRARRRRASHGHE